MLRHICGGLGAPRQTELVEDPAHIVLYRLLGQEQRLADLTVGATLSQSRENLALLFRERGERGVVTAALAQALEHLAGHVRIQQGTTRGDCDDGVDHRLASGLLQEVPGGAGDDRSKERLVVSVRR